jgi:hypothetical protein
MEKVSTTTLLIELFLGYGMYLLPSPNTSLSTGVSIRDDVISIAVFVIAEYLLMSRSSLSF